MKNLKLLIAALCVSIMLCGCGKSNDVIVVVNDKPITQAEFKKEFDKKLNSPEIKQMGIDLTSETNKPLYLLTKNLVIDEMVVTSLIDAEINKRNIVVTDKDVDEEYQRFIKTLGSEAQLKESLKQNNISFSQFKKDLKTELKYRKFINLIANISVSDKDAEAFYKKNADKFNMPERVKASHILVSANRDEIKASLRATSGKDKSDDEINKLVEEEMAKRLSRAQEILAEVKKDTTKFDQIAKEKSDDKVSAKQGGDLGTFTYNQMVEPFSKVAFSQKPNTVSDIVVTPYGYHIIFVQDKMAAGKEPFDKAKENIKAYLEMQQRNKAVADFVENAKKSAKIEYKDESYKPEVIQEEIKKLSAQAPKAGTPVAEEKK